MANTIKSYGQHWDRFAAYCRAQGRGALPATTATVVCFVAHLSTGKLQPQSVQVYLSAINKAHSDLGLDPPAGGSLLASVRSGWELQARSAPGGQREERAALPAVVASRALDAAAGWKGSAESLRPLYVSFCFALMARADTDLHLERRDVELAATCIRVRLRAEKGKARNAERRRLEIPREAIPGLYPALARWQQLQRESYANRTMPGDVSFWRLARVDDNTKWPRSGPVCSGWLAAACRVLDCAPPAGEAWTSHSLRIGAASAANALDVNLMKIKDWGGLALALGAVFSYIRPVLACDAARRFFGWMLARPAA